MSLRFRPTVEVLDRRDVPTMTLVNDVSYPLTGPVGSATVTVGVTTEGDGYYHWNYLLHNDSFVYGQDDYWGLGMLRIPVSDTFVTGMGSSIAADTNVGNGIASWAFGTEVNPGLKPGQEANFWFTTPEVPIGVALVEGAEPGYAVGVTGESLAPKGLTSATLDYSTAKTGEAYRIRIAIHSGSPTTTPSMADLWISVAATDTQQQIRDKVAQKLSQAGFDVEQIGTTKLKVGAKGDQSFGYIGHWNYDATTDTLWNSIPGPKLVGRRGFPTVIINSQEAPLQD